jgi:hypothetical protein
MKNTIKLLLLICIANVSYCQTIKQLEEKNGFKDFHLGDSLPKYKGRLFYEGKHQEYGVSSYSFIGEDNIFEIKLDKILLLFDRDERLVFMILTANYPNSDKEYLTKAKADIQTILSKCNVLFGNPTGTVRDQDEGYFGSSWTGKDIFMQAYIDYQDIGAEGSSINITIGLTSHFMNTLKKGF